MCLKALAVSVLPPLYFTLLKLLKYNLLLNFEITSLLAQHHQIFILQIEHELQKLIAFMYQIRLHNRKGATNQSGHRF